MNYQQYLQGCKDANNNKPRQSLNKDYVLGYTEAIGASLIIGDRIHYDWDMPSVDDTPIIKVSVSAEIEGKENRTIFRVRGIQFVYSMNRVLHQKTFEIALKLSNSNLVHISQIYRKVT